MDMLGRHYFDTHLKVDEMGFTVYYQSTKPVMHELHPSIANDVTELCKGRSWVSCEPIHFYEFGPKLRGGVKPNFTPSAFDIASAKSEGLPDGTIANVIEGLATLSQKYGIDWEFSHDHDPGPIGFIRNGVAESRLMSQIEAFGMLAGLMSGELHDDEFESLLADSADDNEDGDGPPDILRFPGV